MVLNNKGRSVNPHPPEPKVSATNQLISGSFSSWAAVFVDHSDISVI